MSRKHLFDCRDWNFRGVIAFLESLSCEEHPNRIANKWHWNKNRQIITEVDLFLDRALTLKKEHVAIAAQISRHLAIGMETTTRGLPQSFRFVPPNSQNIETTCSLKWQFTTIQKIALIFIKWLRIEGSAFFLMACETPSMKSQWFKTILRDINRRCIELWRVLSW